MELILSSFVFFAFFCYGNNVGNNSSFVFENSEYVIQSNSSEIYDFNIKTAWADEMKTMSNEKKIPFFQYRLAVGWNEEEKKNTQQNHQNDQTG